jgi:hypothetical protein
MIDSIPKASYFSNYALVLGVYTTKECYYTSYTLIDSRRKDLRRLNSEVISSRSGSRYVVGDIRVLLVQLPLMSPANEYILVLFVIVHHREPNVRRLFSQLVLKPRRYQLE